MTETNWIQAAGATAATGAAAGLSWSSGFSLAHVHDLLALASSAAGLAWWVRLWWTNPKTKPPRIPRR